MNREPFNCPQITGLQEEVGFTTFDSVLSRLRTPVWLQEVNVSRCPTCSSDLLGAPPVYSSEEVAEKAASEIAGMYSEHGFAINTD